MNIFIFGFGQSSKNHIKILLGYKFIRKIFVFTDYPAQVSSERVFCVHRNSLSSVLRSYLPDLVLIASSTSSHASDYELSRNLNVPIVFEKPVSDNVNNTFLITSCHQSSFPLYVFFQRRLSPEFRALLAVKNSGLLGKPNSVLCHLSKYKSKSGYGYLSHFGIHYIDLIFSLLNISDYEISSYIADPPGNEKVASISAVCNSSIYLSLLLDCSSKFSLGSSISIQFDSSSIQISDSKVTVVSPSETLNHYNYVLQEKRKLVPHSCTNLGDYVNFWSYFLRGLLNHNLPDNIPTAEESLAVEHFVQACYSNL